LGDGYPDSTLSVHDLAVAQKLSPKYLERILAALKLAGIVKAARGNKGGYQLTRPPEDVTMADVVSALEGPTCVVACLKAPETCAMYETCPTRDLWGTIQGAFDNIMQHTTLMDLVEKKRSKVIDHAETYCI
jgi:Rrf2 family protein